MNAPQALASESSGRDESRSRRMKTYNNTDIGKSKKRLVKMVKSRKLPLAYYCPLTSTKTTVQKATTAKKKKNERKAVPFRRDLKLEDN